MKRSTDPRVQKLADYFRPPHSGINCPCYDCSHKAAEATAEKLIRTAEAAGLRVEIADA